MTMMYVEGGREGGAGGGSTHVAAVGTSSVG